MTKIKIQRKLPATSYASSTIQQNHGEHITEHGLLKWNLNTNTHEFIQIPNDVGYFTIKIENNKFPTDLTLPKFPHVRLLVHNVSITKLEKFIIQLRSNYNIKSLSIVSTADKEYISKSGMTVLGDIKSVDYQNTLINQYLSLHSHNITANILTEIEKINRELNVKLDTFETPPINQWKIKELWFSNLFCFGENNYIDFEDLTGIYGLYSANKTGKSSLLDIILFLLFDKSSRAFKGIDFLNIDKDEFYSKIRFELNGINYFIEKTGTRKPAKKRISDSVSIKTNFWSEDLNGKIENLNGDQRNSTNANIQDVVGLYDNIILTSISLQNNNAGLIDKSQAERKNILSSFLGIDIFERLYQLANVESRQVNTLLTEYKKKNYDTELFTLELDYKKLLIDIDTIEDTIKEYEIQQDDYSKQIISLSSELQKINFNGNINDLKLQKTNHENEISRLDIEYDSIKEKIKEIAVNAKKVNTKLNTYDLSIFETKLKQLEELRSYKQTLSNKINILKVNIKNQKDKLDKLDKLEYDPDCTYCMNNIFVKDAINTKQDFATNNDLLVKLSDELIELNTSIEELVLVETESDKYKKLLDYKEKLRTLYNTLTNNLETVTTKLKLQKSGLKHVITNIEDYYNNQLVIENNKSLKEQIENITSLLDDIKIKHKKESNDLNTLNSKLQLIESKRLQIADNLTQMQTYEEKFIAYEHYLKATHRDGIQYELIKKILPIFEQEINNILSQIVDFKTLIYIDEKNIEMNIVYNDKTWPLKLTSGMEKFISSIAIRVALTKIANITKPNFLIIDEGMGNLDSDNLSNIPILFNYLKSEFDFVFVISHLAIMRDMTDRIIEIDTSKTYSSIQI